MRSLLTLAARQSNVLIFDLPEAIYYTYLASPVVASLEPHESGIDDFSLPLAVQNGFLLMKKPKFRVDINNLDRRSGFNRRWIKSDYSGQERRKVSDRREGRPLQDLLLPEDLDKKKMAGFQKLLVSSTIQLEALTRLLLQKGIIDEQELLEMMDQIQSEYSGNT